MFKNITSNSIKIHSLLTFFTKKYANFTFLHSRFLAIGSVDETGHEVGRLSPSQYPKHFFEKLKNIFWCYIVRLLPIYANFRNVLFNSKSQMTGTQNIYQNLHITFAWEENPRALSPASAPEGRRGLRISGGTRGLRRPSARQLRRRVVGVAPSSGRSRNVRNICTIKHGSY